MGHPNGKYGPGMARSVASQARREVHYTDPDTGQKYRDATNYVYACALECALHGAPNTNRWWDHEYSEEKAGDMIEIILGLAWMRSISSRSCGLLYNTYGNGSQTPDLGAGTAARLASAPTVTSRVAHPVGDAPSTCPGFRPLP